MSAYSFRPPSSAGMRPIQKVAQRILTKDYPLTGWLREITPKDAIAQASEEIIKKLKKKGLRAAKRDKRAREGLPPKEKKKRKKKKETSSEVEPPDFVEEALEDKPKKKGKKKKMDESPPVSPRENRLNLSTAPPIITPSGKIRFFTTPLMPYWP